MIANPYETKSDSFYFVNNKLVMHNKASYKYFREDVAQSKKSYEDKYGYKVSNFQMSSNNQKLIDLFNSNPQYRRWRPTRKPWRRVQSSRPRPRLSWALCLCRTATVTPQNTSPASRPESLTPRKLQESAGRPPRSLMSHFFKLFNVYFIYMTYYV